MTEPNRPAARRRAADATPLLLPLDAGDARPLHRQVYDGLRDAILAGRLPLGSRLPSTRALAADLGVARNTVTLAFEQLRTEGYLDGRRGGGTRVRCAVPDRILDVRAGRGLPPRAPKRVVAERPRTQDVPVVATTPAASPLSARGAAIARTGAMLMHGAGTPAVPFRMGVPALDAFPADEWARLTARRWRRRGVWLGEADPAGERELRAAIASYLEHSRGARCTPEQVVVVSGTQHALDLLARLLLDPGDAAWIEEPGYNGARTPLVAAGARLVPVPVDAEGLDVAAGERLEPRARLAYVTPSHQFPLGAVMSAPRRLALLAWARRAGAWILEDDYDSEFRYAGRPLPCLQGLEAERCTTLAPARVIYVGTFSKTLVPGMRLGYFVLPEALVEPVRAARAAVDRHTSTFHQGALADFIGEGHYARHLRRLRGLYAERQHALVTAAREELGDRLLLAPDAAGLHLLGWLPEGVSDVAAQRAASAHGVEVTPLSRFRLTPAPDARGALLLGYPAFDARAIRSAVRALRPALEEARRSATA